MLPRPAGYRREALLSLRIFFMNDVSYTAVFLALPHKNVVLHH